MRRRRKGRIARPAGKYPKLRRPQGREAGMPVLKAFTAEVQRNGALERASQRAGLRGTAAPAP